MMDENEDYDTNVCSEVTTIGREVAIFRALLNMTQQQFADSISSSRVTINKLENIENSELISMDVAYRLYYITQKTIENRYLSKFTREKAKELQVRVEKEILDRE